MGGDNRAVLYDAVGQIWLELFGEHVHVGYYPDPSDLSSRSWQTAQFDCIDEFLKIAGVRKADKVVDMGCGYGGTAVYVAETLGCKAVGVNISPFQVQAANSLVVRSGLNSKDVYFVVGDALAPELPDGSADLVIAVESSTYMPDKDKFVQQLARLVKPGGTVILVDFMRKDGPMDKALAQRMARMDRIFATAGDWKSDEDFIRMMADNKLRTVRNVEWTRNVRGFWRIGYLELLFRASQPNQTLSSRLWEGLQRTGRVGRLLLTGGPEVAKMAFSLMTGQLGRTVQGGLDSGDIEYHVIVAKKD